MLKFLNVSDGAENSISLPLEEAPPTASELAQSSSLTWSLLSSSLVFQAALMQKEEESQAGILT